MATPKRFIDYPPEYSELLKRAMDKPIRINFDTKIRAKRFRNLIYAFREAIRNSKEEDGVPDDLILTAPLISFKIDGTAVIFHRPKRTSNIQKALETIDG